MPKDPTKKTPTAVNESQELEIQIRERAYELYEARGREDGHDLEDWLRAEEEIMEQKRAPSPPDKSERAHKNTGSGCPTVGASRRECQLRIPGTSCARESSYPHQMPREN